MSKTASYEPPSMDPVIPSPQLACTQAISISEDRTARLRSVSFKRFSTTWVPKSDFTRRMSDLNLEIGCFQTLGDWASCIERSFRIVRPREFAFRFRKSLRWDRTAEPGIAEKRPIAATFHALEIQLLARLMEHAPDVLDPQKTPNDSDIVHLCIGREAHAAGPCRFDFTTEARAFIAAAGEWMRNVKRADFHFELPAPSALSAHERLAIRARARSTPYPT